jgi:antitoxin Phd
MNYHDRKSKTPAKKKVGKPFSTVDLARKTGDVLHAAAQAPVYISKNGKNRFVLMSKDIFDRINPQKAYRTDEMPEDILKWLLPALERAAKGEGYDD